MVVRKLLILLGMFIIILLYGCDYNNLIVNYEIVGTPNRIVYISNLDTNLDLTGLKTVISYRDGSTTETSWGIITEPLESVIHDIDFTIPGVYKVEIFWEWRYIGGWIGSSKDMIISYDFFVQVIDEDTYYDLNGTTERHNGTAQRDGSLTAQGDGSTQAT